MVDNLDQVRRATADGSVQLVAHTDKANNDTRGFSGIEDDADIVWATSREPGAREVSLSCTKMKDGPDGHRIDLHMRTEGESLVVTGGGLSSLAEQILGGFRDTDRQVLEAMRGQFALTGATGRDLVLVTGLSQSAIYSSRGRLLGPGKPLRSDKKHRLWLVEPTEEDSENLQSRSDGHLGKSQVGVVEKDADYTAIPRDIPNGSTVVESSGPASFHGLHEIPRGLHEDSTLRGGL